MKEVMVVVLVSAASIALVFIEEGLHERWGEWRLRRHLHKDIEAWENLAHADRRRIAP